MLSLPPTRLIGLALASWLGQASVLALVFDVGDTDASVELLLFPLFA